MVITASSPRFYSPRFLEQVIHHVRSLVVREFPKAAEATHAEWWAHCRPHASGHQLHFDSEDEGRGTVRHPVVSTVLYLTQGVGGPTLVTDGPVTYYHIWTYNPRFYSLTR